MKILLLADIISSHTYKWAVALRKRDISVGIFCLSGARTSDYTHEGVDIFCPRHFDAAIFDAGPAAKFRFLSVLPFLRKVIREFRPDVLHAHYASSYGILGALSGFHPFILSVWGSDIYDFPRRSYFTRQVLRFNLGQADRVLSTSQAMAVETGKYTRKPISLTPFGIDTQHFCPVETGKEQNNDEIVIGTVKSLESPYGIDLLIKVFHLLKGKHPERKLKLLIVGGGTLEQPLKVLVESLHLEAFVTITGRIPHNEVVHWYRQLDIYAALSRSESFGVAVLEASSCGLPVVVTAVGGLPEVVDDGTTGFIVRPGNMEEAVVAFDRLIESPELRAKMGENGRRKVMECFEWSECVDIMTDIYNEYRK